MVKAKLSGVKDAWLILQISRVILVDYVIKEELALPSLVKTSENAQIFANKNIWWFLA